MAQIMPAGGAEFALFGMEHSGIGIETLKQQLSYARYISCTPMVRIPATTYPVIASVLDAGALGIMVPMVESLTQAETHAMRRLNLPGSVTVDSICASFQYELVTAQHVVHVCQDFTESKPRLVLIEFALENAGDEFRD